MATKAPPLDAANTRRVAGNLLFSRPPRLVGVTAEAFSVSVVLHVLVALGAIWMTLHPPERTAAEEDVLLPMLVEQEKAEEDLPPPPPPPPPPPGQKAVSLEEVPKGFQTLTMPTFVPVEIPPPTAGPEIDEADFSGEGAEGGLARGRADPNATKVVTVEDIAATPAFTPYTVPPVLRNREEIAKLLINLYPPMLRDAGIGGTVNMWILVDERGAVRRTVVKETSELPALDTVAMKVSRRMTFSAAQNRDIKVPVWVALPIRFSTD